MHVYSALMVLLQSMDDATSSMTQLHAGLNLLKLHDSLMSKLRVALR
jgi:hypothetical protein